MARSIEDIKASIWTAWEMTPPASNFSFRKQIANGVARAIWILESLFDVRQIEIAETIQNTRFAYIPWLIDRIKNFQYGQNLIENEVFYDNTGIAEEVIAASNLVKQCAINELRRGLRIKVAGQSLDGILQPLTLSEENALKIYIQKVRPFVPFKLTNQVADLLHLNLKIYYNPLVLDADGKRLDGRNDTPIQQAIETYLKNLSFNGRFVIASMEDALQLTEGVSIPHCVSAQYQYADTGLLEIEVYCIPDAGYLTLENLTVEYIADENL